MEKQKNHAFHKDIYLLGEDHDGVKYWLEAPSWDCDWYWGFGYVETYTNNKCPNLSRDLESHQDFDGLVWFKQDNGEYVYHINECPRFAHTVLSDDEAWELSDLMKRFYVLREAAEIYHRGTANYTSKTGVDSKNTDIAEHINKVDLPAIFARVLEILSPAE